MALLFGSIAGIILTLTALGIISGKVLAIGFLVAVFILAPLAMMLAAKFENWRTSK